MDEKRAAFSPQFNTPPLQYSIIFGYDYVNLQPLEDDHGG
jgi:hypothetical protein